MLLSWMYGNLDFGLDLSWIHRSLDACKLGIIEDLIVSIKGPWSFECFQVEYIDVYK